MEKLTLKELKNETDKKIDDIYSFINKILAKEEKLEDDIKSIFVSLNEQEEKINGLVKSSSLIAGKTLDNIKAINEHEKVLVTFADNKLGTLHHLVNNITHIIEKNKDKEE